MYDELQIVTSGMVKTADDRAEIKIVNHKLDMQNSYRETNYPQKDFFKKKMSTNEYRQFLSNFEMMLSRQKQYINDKILKNGIDFPMSTDEFDAELAW